MSTIARLKERSRPSVSNVTSADVRLATTLSRERHWFTSRNRSVNRTDWSIEIIQRNGRDGSFKDELTYISNRNREACQAQDSQKPKKMRVLQSR